MSATRQWRIEASGFPLDGSSREKLAFAVKYAAIAPPERSWQPWELRLSHEFAELFATRPPASSGLDPEERETLISCGSALEFFKVALKHFGCLGRVERFPSLDDPSLVARIHIGHRGNQDRNDAALFAAMDSLLDLSESPAGPRNSDRVFDEIEAQAGSQSGWLEFARCETTRRKLRSLAETAGRVNVGESSPRPGGLLETVFRRARRGLGGSGVSGPYLTFARWTKPIRHLRIINILPSFDVHPDEADPARRFPGRLALLKTKTDDRRGWLTAGRTLARAILCARAQAVSCTFFTGALGDPSLRTELRTSVGHKGFAQVIVRFQMELRNSDRRPQPTALSTSRTISPPGVANQPR